MRTQAPRAPADDPSRRLTGEAAATLAGMAALRYLQTAPIRVVGPATGRAYAFSASRPVQMVDPRDAEVLARATLFERT